MIIKFDLFSKYQSNNIIIKLRGWFDASFTHDLVNKEQKQLKAETIQEADVQQNDNANERIESVVTVQVCGWYRKFWVFWMAEPLQSLSATLRQYVMLNLCHISSSSMWTDD